MKIRTDFVTNSSSSSFITITVQMLDGTSVVSKNPLDGIGHGWDPLAVGFMKDSDLLKLLSKANNGSELIDVLNEHYKGMFRVSKPHGRSTSLDYQAQLASYEECAYEQLQSITDFGAVDYIVVSDELSYEGAGLYKSFRYDPKSKTVEMIENTEYEEEKEKVFEKDEFIEIAHGCPEGVKRYNEEDFPILHYLEEFTDVPCIPHFDEDGCLDCDDFDYDELIYFLNTLIDSCEEDADLLESDEDPVVAAFVRELKDTLEKLERSK